MATQILAIGHTAASSADQALAAGALAKIMIKPALGKSLTALARVNVELKTADGAYVVVGKLGAMPAADIIGPCTFRVTRPALAPEHACGVDLA